MAEIVFILCAVTSIASAAALFRGYKKSLNRLLLWGALSFLFLALNNVFLCADLIFFPQIDLHGSLIRNLLASISGGLLLFGLIWEIA
jgi:Family of unknown function (DUF5985)